METEDKEEDTSCNNANNEKQNSKEEEESKRGENILKILKGDLDAKLPKESKIVRIFTSSTFTGIYRIKHKKTISNLFLCS